MEEKQTLTITIVFKEHHTPGNEQHLQQIVDNYFRGKGVPYSLLDNIIEM